MLKLETAPAFKIAILLIAGILIGAFFKFNSAIIILLFILSSLYIYYLYKKHTNETSIIISLSVLIILLGIFKASIDFNYTPNNSIKFFPDTKRNDEIKLIGIIEERPVIAESKIKFIVNAERIVINNDTTFINGSVMTTAIKSQKLPDTIPMLNAGDKVLLYGKLSGAVDERNPGEFDYKKYLELHEIYKIFSVKGYYNIEILSRDNLNWFEQKIIYPAKIFASGNIDSLNPGEKGAFLKGLVTGERADITKEMKDAFINAGVMHIIAVSGLNVAYIILSVTLVLVLFRVPLLPRTVITIIFIIFYCFFTGASASILRASIMGILVLLSFLIQRKINFYNIIGIAVILILLYDSKQLFDAGFILSFSAVLSMVFFYNKFEELFLVKIENWKFFGNKTVQYIIIIFLTSLAAQIGTIPLTAHYFGKISFVSLLANAIAVPLSNLSLAIGFFQIVVSVFSNYLSTVIAGTNNLLLYLQLVFIKWCASLNFAYIEFFRFNLINTFLYFGALLLLITSKKKNIRNRILIFVLIVSFAIILNLDFRKELKITFISVGQGDCTLLQTPDGSNILIDCGPDSWNYGQKERTENIREINNEKLFETERAREFNSGELTIAPYLKRLGIKCIDMLIVSHYHSDHIGGLSYILENFEVKKIVDNGVYDNKHKYIEIENLILKKQIPRDIIKSGDIITGFGDLKFYFLNPVMIDTEDKDNNVNAIAFKLKYKNSEMLYMSDISFEGENNILNVYGDFVKSGILKIAHHGSKNASSTDFINKCKPEYSVISCGRNNNFGHPANIVLENLEKIGSKICRTDLDGAVIFVSDGNSFRKEEWK